MEAFIPPRQGLGLLTSRWAAFGLFAAGLSFSGCSCDEPIGKLNGQLGLDPEMLDFGDVPVGAEKELPLKLTNKGSYLLTIKSYSATMPFIGPTGTTTLSPSESKTVNVKFHVPALGPATGTLTILDDDPKVPMVEVPLMGNGIEAAVTVDPLRIDFGEIEWTRDTRATERTVTVTNPGTDSFELTALDLTESASAAFTLIPGTAKKTYAPRTSDTFKVSFLPKKMGLVNGRVSIKTTAPNAAEIVVDLLGTGVGPILDLCAGVTGQPELCVSRGDVLRVNLGLIELNAMATGWIRVANIGTRPMRAQGQVNGPVTDFMFAPDVMGAGEFMLNPGMDRRFDITYTAHDYFFDSIIVGFGTNAAERMSATARVEARVRQSDINVSPTGVSTTLEGAVTHDEIPVNIFNCGQSALTLGPITFNQTQGAAGALSLAMVPPNGTVIQPQTCPGAPPGATLKVVFDTTVNGTYGGQITINSSDPVNPVTTVDVTATKR